VIHADPELQARRARSAYRRRIVNRILFAAGMAFVNPVTVIPTFVARLTDSDLIIGLISGFGMSGWFLPQFFSGTYLRSQPHKRPVYVYTAFLRAFGLLLAVLAVYFLTRYSAAAALLGFALGYAVYALGGGVGGPAFLDIVAKTIPGNRLGAFFGHREFWGGIVAIACGFLVGAILAQRAIPFPANYSLLFALALASFAPGWLIFATIHEPPGRTAEPQALLPFLRTLPALLREHSEFRLLLVSRLFTGSGAIAVPFYIIYCRRVLAVPEAAAGTYLSVQMAGSVMLIPLWAYLNDRRGPRALLITVAILAAAVPLIALAVASYPSGTDFDRIAFGFVFFPLIAIGAGSFMGYHNYLFAIAPEEQRPLYIGVQNTLFAITGFLPLLGGLVVEHASFRALFALAAIIGSLGFIATLRLSDRRPSAGE